jgi:hypothetical protein
VSGAGARTDQSIMSVVAECGRCGSQQSGRRRKGPGSRDTARPQGDVVRGTVRRRTTGPQVDREHLAANVRARGGPGPGRRPLARPVVSVAHRAARRETPNENEAGL